jgi:hypothetical protein
MKIVREYLESQFFQKIHLGSSILCQTLYLFYFQKYNNEHEYLIKKMQFKEHLFFLHNIHAKLYRIVVHLLNA